jgi:hypothetical protein
VEELGAGPRSVALGRGFILYSQTPTTVHAAPPAAPNPSAASITSANKNWLMTMLSELDNDVIMDLIQP